MIRDDIVKWAEKAGIMPPNWGATEHQWRSLERFAALAYEAGRKDENEACAVMTNILQKSGVSGEHLADAIRARREQ